MRSCAPVLVLLVSCASSPPAVKPAPPPAAAAPADPWAVFDATASKYVHRLATDLDCASGAKAMAPFCRIGAGWDGAEAIEIPDGQHVLAGISMAFAPGEATDAAFKRPLLLSAMAVTHDGAGVRIHLVLENPTGKTEFAEVDDAQSWFVAYLMGEAPGIRLVGGLAKQVDALRQRADTPTVATPHGLRFQQPDGTRGELRRVGEVFVVVEQPPGVDGVLLSVLTEKVKLDPDAAPGSPP